MPISVGDIASALGAEAVGDLSVLISGPREPAAAGPGHLALAMEPSYGEALGLGSARAAIVWPGADWRAMGLEAAIFAPRPRYALAGISRFFEKPVRPAPGIHPTAFVDPDARIGINPSIGPFVVVASGARVGDNARILSHVSIGEDASIGDDALLHSGARIGMRVRIGNRFIAQLNAAIGGDGFSFVTPEPGATEEARITEKLTEASRTQGYTRINSLGSVTIGDDVEIGANSTVDRGTVADTEIGDGTKIDNLVQVGHNVRIGMHCLLCAQCGVAGSSKIGDRVVLAGQTAIADHVHVGSDVIVTGRSCVFANVPSNSIMMGTPALRKDLAMDAYKAYRRLPRLFAKVAELQKRVLKTAPKD